MIKRIFNVKNFVRATVFAIITFLLYWVTGFLFKSERDLNFNLMMALSFFLINFILGTEEVTWKELFFGKRNKKKVSN
ncbi:hypothetical protein RM51_01715 [Chryseobacterium taiwanense]|uniref:Uncharacterized protein n=1 Tax=Chryseobacterium taiwanense TaxID=363331 RepID=A0A0B4D8V3_9FLAO|nr:hypothetical protein RM51_01715 [Chryseobacterium taiwanense]